MAGRRTTDPFVGREREMAALDAALEDVLAGRGHLVMLVGEPGIGKTRLAEEFAQRAVAGGAIVLRGGCYEGGGAPSYWPWVQAIRQHVQGIDLDQLKAEMGALAPVVAEIVQDVKERMPGIQPPPPLDSPESARFRLFDSVASFLRNASRTRPLVLVLDDLHWSDKPSLLLLEFVARDLGSSRILVVGTYRDVELSRKHPLAATLGELTKDRLFERVVLRGLRKEDVATFVQTAARVPASPGLVDAIYTQTEGNPLFVTEVIRLLAQEGELFSVRIPEGVKEVIGRRLDRLSDRCNEVLVFAAVMGREFRLAALVSLYTEPGLSVEERLAEDRLLNLIEEAFAARVIEDAPSGPGELQFTHALVQETLISELSAARRVRLHARIALALERMYGKAVEQNAAELAEHFAEAEAILGAEKFVKYSLIAGERALAEHAPDEALRLFERCLAVKQVPEVSRERADLYFGLGRAQQDALPPQDRQEAVETLTRAFDCYLAIGDRQAALRVALHPVWDQGGITRASGLFRQALELAAPDSPEEAILLSEFAGHTAIETGDTPELQQKAERALEIARRSGDLELELRILSGSRYRPDVREQTRGSSRRLLELATILNNKDAEFRGLWNLMFDLHVEGDTGGVKELLPRLLSLAKDSRQTRTVLWAWMGAAAFAMRTGDWDDARRICDESLRSGNSYTHIWGSRAYAEYQTGEFSAGEGFIDMMVEAQAATTPGPSYHYVVPGVLLPLVAHITGDRSRLEYARRISVSASQSTSFRAHLGHLGLGLVAAELGDPAGAKAAYQQLLKSGPYLFVVTYIERQRALALVANAAGQREGASNHFRESIAFNRRAGFKPELAWACFDYSEMLESSGRPDKEDEPANLRREALGIARELGMKPLIERITARESRRGNRPELPDGLTEREVEVLRLIAAGKSNAQIAQALVIAPNTAAKHVANILGKIGAANRAEAATYANKHGLVS